MNIDFKIIGVVMLFVILISIHITLNKILIVLKEIKQSINNKNRIDMSDTIDNGSYNKLKF